MGRAPTAVLPTQTWQAMGAADRPSVLGIPIDAAGMAAVDARLAAADGLTHVATVNPEYAMLARRDPVFAAALAAAEVHLADGVGITLALRLRGIAAVRATGVALVDHLVATGEPTFLLGAAPGVAEAAARVLAQRHRLGRVAGWWADGTPDRSHDDESLRRIVASGATVVLVAYGAAGQVAWIERNRARLETAGVRVAAGIGGALDYHAGRTRLAHPLVRRVGLEWLNRLAREPWRWRRQTVLPVFALLAVGEAGREALRGRRGAGRRRPV